MVKMLQVRVWKVLMMGLAMLALPGVPALASVAASDENRAANADTATAAETITISPANPTTDTPVTISLRWVGCIQDFDFTQNGYTFNAFLEIQNFCTVSPSGVFNISVGRLPPGTYTVVYDVMEEGGFSGSASKSFQVRGVSEYAVFVPALDFAGFSVLIIAMLAFAIKFRHRIAS